MIKELQLLGLGKNEAKVYEALVKYGPCKAGILINKLDIHRNLVYQSLEKLVENGYATKIIKRGIWHFQITDPQSLLTSYRSKEKILTEVVKSIQTYQQKTDQQIVVYEGIESYRNYWIESLERFPVNTIDYTIGAETNNLFEEMLGPTIFRKYMGLRVEKHIKWKTVHFKITEHERKMLREYPELTEYRLWRRPDPFTGNFNIIHDTVILKAITNPPRIIEIRDKDLVTVFKNYFDMIWEKSEPVIV